MVVSLTLPVGFYLSAYLIIVMSGLYVIPSQKPYDGHPVILKIPLGLIIFFAFNQVLTAPCISVVTELSNRTILLRKCTYG